MKNFIPNYVYGAFESFTPESLQAFVKGLRIKTNTESKGIPGVGIVFKGTRITVRIKREPKVITREEIELLAKEYSKTEQELISLLLSRKVTISYEPNDTRATDELSRASEAKRNARNKTPKRIKNTGSYKFFEPGHNPQLPEEGTVPAPHEPESGSGG